MSYATISLQSMKYSAAVDLLVITISVLKWAKCAIVRKVSEGFQKGSLKGSLKGL